MISKFIKFIDYLFTEEDPQAFKTVSFKFHRLFNLPVDDKLVNYYSCRSVQEPFKNYVTSFFKFFTSLR